MGATDLIFKLRRDGYSINAVATAIPAAIPATHEGKNSKNSNCSNSKSTN